MNDLNMEHDEQIGSHATTNNDWVTAMNTMYERIQGLEASLARTNDASAMRRRIQELEATLAQAEPTNPTPQITDTNSEDNTIGNNAKREETSAPPSRTTRPIYPDVEMFSGEDLKQFDAFKLNLKLKLANDEQCYFDDAKKVSYAFSRLTGKASQRLLPWMNAKIQGDIMPSFAEFYKELDRAFSDPDRRQQALVRIHRMKQGKKDLREFLGEFNQVLAEAGALTWTDEQKKGFLEAAVNVEVLQALIGNPTLGGDDSYESYCETLLRVDQQQKRLQGASKGRPRISAYDTQRVPSTIPKSKDPNTMDWEPTVAALRAEVATLRTNQPSKTQRARWVPDSEIQARRAQGVCYRCGTKGHLVKDCDFLPARKPTTAQMAYLDTEGGHEDQDQSDAEKD